MKLKKNITAEWNPDGNGFWYDLVQGGYINPKDFLSAKDAKLVEEAKSVLEEFEILLETKFST